MFDQSQNSENDNDVTTVNHLTNHMSMSVLIKKQQHSIGMSSTRYIIMAVLNNYMAGVLA